MARVLRTSIAVKVKDAGRKAKKKAVKQDEDDFDLPTEYAEPSGDINDFAFLIHGPKKIGKTTLANNGGRVFFMQFDPAQKAYRRLERVIKSAKQFEKLLRKLEDAAESGKKFPYDRVVIDGCDDWYNLAMASACEKLAIDHPSEEDFGKGWNAVKLKFRDWVDRFLKLPCGRWFLCHSEWQEVETRRGAKVAKLLPVLSGQAEKILNGKVDGWFAYDFADEQRILVVQGDERTGAGHRLYDPDQGSIHFTTKKGRVIREINMRETPKQGWEEFLAAFNNELTYTKVGEGIIAPTFKKNKFKK